MSRTWSRRGTTPIITTAGGWKSRSLLGTIMTTPHGERVEFFAHVHHDTVRSEHVIAYLKDIRKHVRRKKLILIWDGLKAHTSGETQAFIQSQSSWLTVERFPTYAPELNPVEYGWSNLKRAGFSNACFATEHELDQAIDTQVRRLSRSRNLLRGCLKASGLYC